jgi:hypothetical protein
MMDLVKSTILTIPLSLVVENPPTTETAEEEDREVFCAISVDEIRKLLEQVSKRSRVCPKQTT